MRPVDLIRIVPLHLSLLDFILTSPLIDQLAG
jgi:hypothetical protein